jgi:hypothetical protein
MPLSNMAATVANTGNISTTATTATTNNLPNPWTVSPPGAVSITSGTGGGYGSGGATGATGSNGNYIYSTGGTSGITWGNTSNYGNVTANDITLNGRSLTDHLSAIEKRLAILVPDPKKLEKYEALKAAYEHYKLLEKLCSEPDKNDSNP